MFLVCMSEWVSVCVCVCVCMSECVCITVCLWVYVRYVTSPSTQDKWLLPVRWVDRPVYPSDTVCSASVLWATQCTSQASSLWTSALWLAYIPYSGWLKASHREQHRGNCCKCAERDSFFFAAFFGRFTSAAWLSFQILIAHALPWSETIIYFRLKKVILIWV